MPLPFPLLLFIHPGAKDIRRILLHKVKPNHIMGDLENMPLRRARGLQAVAQIGERHADLVFEALGRRQGGVGRVDGELARAGDEFGRGVEGDGIDLGKLRLGLRHVGWVDGDGLLGGHGGGVCACGWVGEW